MEEMMMIHGSNSSSPNNQSNDTSNCYPSWKVYDNPFYYPHHHHHHHHHQQQWQSNEHIIHHQVNFPFWEFAVMDSELDLARAQIVDMQAELQYEVKARKKAELLNKKLAKELAEQRSGREALERVCEKLAREISYDKEKIDKMKKEFEEERKMLRMAEVLREERVQMKMAEAKFLFEEKVLELEETKRIDLSGKLISGDDDDDDDDDVRKNNVKPPSLAACKENVNRSNVGVASVSSSSSSSSMANVQRRSTPETSENPHIKRGIKGFVEFPKVVRAIGSKSKHWGSKLECQKAQLRILLKQKSPIRSNNLIMS